MRSNIRSTSCHISTGSGNNSVYCRTFDNHLVSSKMNGYYYTCNRIWSDTLSYYHWPEITEPITMMDTGRGFTFLKTQSGLVYSWGRNADGQQGTNNSVDKKVEPTTTFSDKFNEYIPLITGFTCNDRTAGASLSDGTVIFWGDDDKGQCGSPSTHSRYGIPYNAGEFRLICLGQNQTYGVKNDGTVYGWGINNYDCLPSDPENYTIRTSTIQQIRLDESGNPIYNEDGNEIYDTIEKQTYFLLSPKPLNGFPSNIIDIMSDVDRTYILTSQGQVYFVGRNYKGCSGLGKTEAELPKVSVPTLIPELNNIVKMSCSCYTAWFINATGELYFVGYVPAKYSPNWPGGECRTPLKLMVDLPIIDVGGHRYESNGKFITSDGKLHYRYNNTINSQEDLGLNIKNYEGTYTPTTGINYKFRVRYIQNINMNWDSNVVNYVTYL